MQNYCNEMHKLLVSGCPDHTAQVETFGHWGFALFDPMPLKHGGTKHDSSNGCDLVQ